MQSKLILGTAQFGSDYGIKHDGQPSINEIEKIAQVAWDGGIRIIHTSWQYNLPKICDAIFSEFEKIEKNRENPDLFIWKNKIGYSLYHPDQITRILKNGLFQVPINILDKRFLVYKKYDFTLIARSVFLQGLLLMERENLPWWLSKESIQKIFDFQIVCRFKKLQYYEAALGWILGLEDIDHVIVGVNNAEQLKQLLKVKSLKWEYDFSIQDENVLDPRRWPKA